MRRHARLRQMAAFAALLGAPAMPAAAAPEGQTFYRNQKYGFVLTLPADLVPGAQGVQEVGGVWQSRDGQTRLLAVAGPNATGERLMAYRRFVMEQTYKGATFDYTPVRDSWFVLSGRMDGKMFYERITFACEGRYIYGWQLTYPVVERARWDRVVEAIHRSYRPGRGEDGRCGRSLPPS